MIPRIPFTVALLIQIAPGAIGQVSDADSTLKAANRFYNTGAYESAELTARRLMEQSPLADSLRTESERIIAFSLVAQGKTVLAREHFESILAMNPSFSLDPILTSPKILTVFQEAKLHSATARNAGLVLDNKDDLPRPPTTLRTILFPGWEQYYQGRTTVGLVFAAAGILSLGSGLTYEVLRANARRDYLAATQPADIAGKYETYNRCYRGEVYSLVAFAAVYIASEFDVFFNTSRSVEFRSSTDPALGPGVVLSLRW